MEVGTEKKSDMNGKRGRVSGIIGKGNKGTRMGIL